MIDKSKWVIAVLVAAMSVSAQASSGNGTVEAQFPSEAKGTLAVHFAAGCIDKGWIITNQSDVQVSCEGDPDPLSHLEYLASSNRYSSPLRGFYNFIILSMPDHIRVQASGYSEYRTGFGQPRRILLQFPDDLKDVLTKAGGAIKEPNASVTK